MKITLPDLPIVETSDFASQVNKVEEEARELVESIELFQPGSDSSLYDMLGEALDTAQAIAGLLELIDDSVLDNAIEIHTEKLQRKYSARGYTVVIRREVR